METGHTAIAQDPPDRPHGLHRGGPRSRADGARPSTGGPAAARWPWERRLTAAVRGLALVGARVRCLHRTATTSTLVDLEGTSGAIVRRSYLLNASEARIRANLLPKGTRAELRVAQDPPDRPHGLHRGGPRSRADGARPSTGGPAAARWPWERRLTAAVRGLALVGARVRCLHRTATTSTLVDLEGTSGAIVRRSYLLNASEARIRAKLLPKGTRAELRVACGLLRTPTLH